MLKLTVGKPPSGATAVGAPAGGSGAVVSRKPSVTDNAAGCKQAPGKGKTPFALARVRSAVSRNAAARPAAPITLAGKIGGGQ